VRVAIYARVGTTGQKCEMQLAELHEYVSRRGWQPAGEYVNTGWSGNAASRPEYDRLLKDAAQRKIDVMLCWKLDRFGSSLLNCKSATEGLRARARVPNYGQGQVGRLPPIPALQTEDPENEKQQGWSTNTSQKLEGTYVS
jgi:hypothetical protein